MRTSKDSNPGTFYQGFITFTTRQHTQVLYTFEWQLVMHGEDLSRLLVGVHPIAQRHLTHLILFAKVVGDGAIILSGVVERLINSCKDLFCWL